MFGCIMITRNETSTRTGPAVISVKHEIFLLINVTKNMSRKKAFLAYLSLKKTKFLDIFILMSI